MKVDPMAFSSRMQLPWPASPRTLPVIALQGSLGRGELRAKRPERGRAANIINEKRQEGKLYYG